jgi:hypothetical protein
MTGRPLLVSLLIASPAFAEGQLDKVWEVKNLALQLSFTPDGQTWLTGEWDKIGVWSGRTRVREVPYRLIDHNAALDAIAAGTRAAAGSALVDLADGRVIFAGAPWLPSDPWVNDPQIWNEDAAFTPDGGAVIVLSKWHPSKCCRDRHAGDKSKPTRVFVWTSATDGREVPGVVDILVQHNSLAASRTAFAVAGTTLTLIDRTTLAPLARVKAEQFAFSFPRFSADGKLLAVRWGGARTLKIFAVPALTEVASFQPSPGDVSIEAVAFHPTLPLVAVATFIEHKLVVYDLTTRTPVAKLVLPGAASAMAFRPGAEPPELVVAVRDRTDTVIAYTLKR